MLLYLGREASKAAQFSQVLAKDLKKKHGQMLTESTFQSLLPKMDKKTRIVIERGANVGKYQELLVKTIKERDITLIMMESNEGDLHVYGVAMSPQGKYVAVKNRAMGRRQEVLVIGDEDLLLKHGVEKVTAVMELSGSDSQKEPTTAAHCPAAATKVDAKTAEMRSLVEFLDEKDEPPSQGESTHYWEHNIKAKFEQYIDLNPTNSEAPDWLNDRLKTGHVKAFCTVHVNMYATKTPRQKWIQFKLTDAVGINAKMGSDDNWAKGYFNRYANIYIYPGYSTDPDHSMLPSGWDRPNVEPHTPNSSTTYTSTTGWSFGVTGGGDADGPSANVTASYSASNQVQTTIQDFSVRNNSDASMSGWHFYYTAVDGDNWMNHFTANNAPKPIANLAKSTLHMNAEAVYEGPPDTNEKISFTIKPDCQFACLRGNLTQIWLYYYDFHFPGGKHLSLDMGVVENPAPGFY